MTKIKDPSWYEGREQTYVKHFVLANYLQRLAHIVGPHVQTLTYIDAFAGPWGNKDGDLDDTSPKIALGVLTEATDSLQKRGKQVGVRAMFIEKNKAGVDALKAGLPQAAGTDLLVTHGKFEQLMPEAVTFARRAGTFCFTFIDPCGWTGMNLAEITPLLRVTPGEVLVNFMTDHINRFVDHPDAKYAAQFEALFGSTTFRDAWVNLQGDDRQEAMVGRYCERVREAGGFRHVISAVVLNPLKSRAYFHLVYATRSDMGLKVFRDIERQALGEQSSVGAKAQQRARKDRSGQQGELFPSEVMATPHVDELRDRYRRRAVEVVTNATPAGKAVSYRDVAVAAMQVPTIADQDVKDILKEQRKKGSVQFLERATVAPDLTEMSARHVVQWNGLHFILRTSESG